MSPSDLHQSGDLDIGALLAERAIRVAVQDYCRGIDRLDRELLSSSFHPEARVILDGYFDGPVADLVEFVIETHKGYEATSHHVTNLTVCVRRTAAVSEAYVLASMRLPNQDGVQSELVFRGRYLDRWLLCDARWAATHRRLVADMFSRRVVDVLDRVTDADEGLEPGGRAASRLDPGLELFREFELGPQEVQGVAINHD